MENTQQSQQPLWAPIYGYDYTGLSITDPLYLQQQHYYSNYYYPQSYDQLLSQYYNRQPSYEYQPQYYQLNQNPQPPKNQQPKLSRNQKRKQKLKEKKQELEEQRKQIGDWVKYQSKPLIQSIQRLEEQEKKRIEKKKAKLSHLVEIGKEIYKLRKKMGLLRAETAKAKMVKALKITHKKKPSIIKRMNHKYQKMLQKLNTAPIKQETQTEWENQEDPKEPVQDITKISIIEYPQPGKLTNTLFNNITLRQWVDHLPSQSIEEEVLVFVNRLAYQQAVKKTKQPLKYKKRIVAGFNECLRTVKSQQIQRKSKLLIVALNIIFNPLKLSCDQRTIEIIQAAKKAQIPILHASTRSKLGRAFLGKFGPRISVISVINYEGSKESYDKILELRNQLQTSYNNL